ncbi:unnamed protein product [Amaranthus hypochondriacus]
MTSPFSTSSNIDNFTFSSNMTMIPHTPFSSSSSCLFDVYQNGLMGMKSEMNNMDFPNDFHGKTLLPSHEVQVGSSNNEIKENNKKESNYKEKKIRRHRYAFHTRTQVDILDDGYRWRKYGQKAVKNNKFPRSYYRCTYGGCNVKKQVQRLTKDEEVVVTTYEGIHTHPVERSTDNFEHILKQMHIYVPP